MKDNIYTIPLIDAFNSGHECPFCFIHNNMESDALEFMLGSAYMAGHIREETNKIGFCSHHYNLLYEHGNRLGLAMIMHSHLLELKKGLEPLLKGNHPKSTASAFSMLSQKIRQDLSADRANNNISEHIHQNGATCYVCNKINKDMTRYLDTLFFVWKQDPKFVGLVENCKGFCLSHFAQLLHMAPLKLSGHTLQGFYDIIIPITQKHLDRVEDELAWFIDKFDYRNKNASWKNSKDAVPRTIQKLASVYVGDSSEV